MPPIDVSTSSIIQSLPPVNKSLFFKGQKKVQQAMATGAVGSRTTRMSPTQSKLGTYNTGSVNGGSGGNKKSRVGTSEHQLADVKKI